MKTPVIFLTFNRPPHTEAVFEQIRKIKPQTLFWIQDGARDSHEGEREKVETVKKIREKIDWPCELVENRSEINLGCKMRVSSGLSWAFDQVEQAIILEDDCVPSLSFFPYCEELLDRYREDEKVGMITGTQMDDSLKHTLQTSYTFTRFAQIWGWATWRRAWKKYDVTLKDWPDHSNGAFLEKHFDAPNLKPQIDYWKYRFSRVYKNKVNTWDYQWAYTQFKNSALCISPKTNLIQNVGFDSEATHTKSADRISERRHSELIFPLIHPGKVVALDELDVFSARHQFKFGLKQRVGSFLDKFNLI